MKLFQNMKICFQTECELEIWWRREDVLSMGQTLILWWSNKSSDPKYQKSQESYQDVNRPYGHHQALCDLKGEKCCQRAQTSRPPMGKASQVKTSFGWQSQKCEDKMFLRKTLPGKGRNGNDKDFYLHQLKRKQGQLNKNALSMHLISTQWWIWNTVVPRHVLL